MAWISDLRDALDDVLEMAAATECTCRVNDCLAHRADWVRRATMWNGVPTRRWNNPLRPRLLPVHTLGVAHGPRTPSRWDDTHHDRERCLAWCVDCGARVHGRCQNWQAGDRLTWWADYPPSPASGAHDERPCLDLLARPVALVYEGDEVAGSRGAQVRRLPEGLHRRPG